jgi:hypothetical protein
LVGFKVRDHAHDRLVQDEAADVMPCDIDARVSREGLIDYHAEQAALGRPRSPDQRRTHCLQIAAGNAADRGEQLATLHAHRRIH